LLAQQNFNAKTQRRKGIFAKEKHLREIQNPRIERANLKRKLMSENQNPPPIQSPSTPPSPDNRARTWNMLCHLSALAGFIIPFGNILGPLIVWQIKKNEFPSVDVHGKAALNFQITVTIAAFVGAALAILLSFFCVGYLLFPLVAFIGLAGLILAIIAGIKANNGEDYKYPWSLELVK
jgi:hypothetical protein